MDLLKIDVDKTLNVRLIGHINYTTPWKHFTRILDEYVMYVIKSGELYLKEGNTEYILKKGDLLILEPNIEHTGYKEACCHYYFIHFNSSAISKSVFNTFEDISKELIGKRKLSLSSDHFVIDSSVDSINYLPKHYHFNNEFEIFSLLAEANYDFYQKYENYRKIVSLKFQEFIIRACINYADTKIESTEKHFNKSFIKVREVVNYLQKHYREPIISKDIEELFESNYNYLNRMFQKMTGDTIMNYVNLIRINRARDLMSTTTIKFSEIGYLVGINDPYYFSKLFKKLTNMTASQYIKSRDNTFTKMTDKEIGSVK